MNKFLRALLLSTSILIPLVAPKTVRAHGGGPPFLLMNGKVANTNPLYLGSTKVFTAQDLAPDKYVAGSPIEFKIDLDALAAGIAGVDTATLGFRWSFEEGSADYSFEKNPTQTYMKSGTHYLTFEAKPEGNPDWATLDTVKIDVVPSADYQLPTTQIATIGSSYQVGKPITFVGQAKTNKNNPVGGYFWDLGDTTSKNKTVAKNFSDDGENVLPYPIFLRVTDGSGVVTEDLIYTRIIDKKVLLNGSIHESIPTASLAEKSSKSASGGSLFFFWGLGVLLLLVLVVIIVLWLRKKRGQ